MHTVKHNTWAVSLVAFGLFLGTLVQAQDTNSNRAKIKHWRCTMPGGTFTTSLSAIRAVTLHEYVVDGVAKVTEVNVATDSSVLARFYYIEPVRPTLPVESAELALQRIEDEAKKRGAALLEQSGQADAINHTVIKNYPLSTHAHTVEYRVDSTGKLNKIFESAETAWLTQQTRNIRVE